MSKTEKIRYLYAIAIGVFVVAMGIAFICVAADIYYSGGATQGAFTQEVVVKRLQHLAIPFIILIGAIAVGAVFPLFTVRMKPTKEHAVKLLSEKLPSGGEGEEYEAAEKNFKKLRNIRLYVWAGECAVLLGCTVAVLVYMLNTSHFLSENITGEIFAMVKNVLPWIAVAFVTLVGVAVANGYIAGKQVKELKALIKYGNREPREHGEPEWIIKAKKALSSDITLWVARGIVFVVAVTFIILGIVNGGANDVLIKAINICTECIGLG